MNEKYGIELELLTSAFNRKINQIKSRFSEIKNQRVELKTDSSQLEYLEYQIKQVTAELNRLKAIPATSPKFNYGDILKTEASLEKLRNQYERLSNSERKVETQSSSTINSLQKGIGKVTSKIKRFALSLIGIRSIFSMVSRASSAYLSQDTARANKLQAVWVGLGAMLEPVISAIANVMIKAVKYINIFIKALTGVDLLAKATQKSLAKTTKSAKALSKVLAGFDELNNLDTTSDVSSPSIDTSGLNAFNDVEIDTAWTDKIRAFGEWFKENWKPIAIGIGVVVGALLGFKIITTIVDWFKKSKSVTSGLSADFTGLFNSIGKATEAIAILGGLAIVINSLTGLIDSFSESGMSLGEVAGLLGIVLGELTLTFIALLGVMTLLTPSWQSIAAATIIFAGLAAIILVVTNLIDTFSKSGLTLGDVIGLLATILISIVALMGAVALIGPLMTAGLVPFVVVIAGICALLLVMGEVIPKILNASREFIVGIAPSVIMMIREISNGIQGIIYSIGVVLPPIIQSVRKYVY